MARDAQTTERLHALLAKITSLTAEGQLQWERQLHSAHRYARWNNHLLILGPGARPDDRQTPRYLFITPFDSPDCIEINSNDAELGEAVLTLMQAAEASTIAEPPTDPFALTSDLLNRLES